MARPNEAGIAGKAIGAIEIADGYALVEVPEEAADDVARALNAATIRGAGCRCAESGTPERPAWSMFPRATLHA